MVCGAAGWLAAPADAASVEVKAFHASQAGSQIKYEIVLCAPVGADLAFRPEVAGTRGTTYVLPELRGRQPNACPTWTFKQAANVPPGRYTTRVVIERGGKPAARTRRVALELD